MNTAVWIAEGVLTLIFLYSGLMKASQSEQRLVAIGQTGVQGLPLWLIRFIGISEIIGALGLIGQLIHVAPVLTPVAALCLGSIMLPAAIIHYRRQERKTVLLNGAILLLCLWVAYQRV